MPWPIRKGGSVKRQRRSISPPRSAAEQKTLLVDLDPQANASSGVGLDRSTLKCTTYHALLGEAKASEIVCNTPLDCLQILPATADLIGAEIELVSVPDRETRLRSCLSEISNNYKYVVIDCPPSLGLLTINALTAADSVLVPLQCEYYAMEGLSQLIKTIRLIQRQLNPDLTLKGILLTMFDRRNNLSHQVSEEIRRHFSNRVFETVIPRNVRLSEAPSHGLPVLLYDIASTGAAAYLSLAKEIISTGN